MSLRAGETQIELTAGMRTKIRNYALHGGGIYRMNTVGATYYSFTPFNNEKGKTDFCGGWDWISSALSTYEAYVYDMEEDKFFTTEKFKKEHS